MLVSIPMGLIAFRLRGSYFAIGTSVRAEVCSLLMINNTSVGGGSGASIKVTDYDLTDAAGRHVLVRASRRRRRRSS